MIQHVVKIVVKLKNLHVIEDFVVDVRENQDQVVIYVMLFKKVNVPVVMVVDLSTRWQEIKKKSRSLYESEKSSNAFLSAEKYILIVS